MKRVMLTVMFYGLLAALSLHGKGHDVELAVSHRCDDRRRVAVRV